MVRTGKQAPRGLLARCRARPHTRRSSCDPYKFAARSVSNPNAVPGHTPGRPGSVAASPRRPQNRRGFIMLDLIFIAAGLAFFALSEGYALLCDRF